MALSIDELRSRPSRRRFEAMFAPPSTGRDEEGLGYLSAEDTASGLSALARNTLNTADTVATVLDTPNAILRGALAGKPLSGFSMDSGTRVGGAELLTQYGLLNKDANPYFKYLAGLAAEVALDPLLPITGPLKALSYGGKAAKSAGIIGDAGIAALAKMGGGSLTKGAEVARSTMRTGRNAYKFLGDLIPNTQRAVTAGTPNASLAKALVSESNIRDTMKLRPLVGQRTAQSMVTLEETIKASSDPNALTKVKAYLDKKGLDYDSVKGETLGGALGFDYFGLHKPLVWNPKGAQPYLDALDAVGQAARWTAPFRVASQLSDQRVGGRYGAADQFFSMRKAAKVAEQAGYDRVTGAKNAMLANSVQLPDAAKKLLGSDTLNSEEGMKFLTRMYEGVETVSDMRLRAAIGAPIVDNIVGNWDNIREGIADTAKSLGYPSRRMVDEYGTRWSPRRAKEVDFGEAGKGVSRADYTLKTGENESRVWYLRNPGATVAINELSGLPEVTRMIREGSSSGLSMDDIANSIRRYMNDRFLPGAANPRVRPFKTRVPLLDAQGNKVREPVLDAAGNPKLNRRGQPITKIVIDPTQVLTQRQATKMARFVARRNPALDNSARIFSESPLVRQAAAIESQGRAAATAREVYRSMGEAAFHVGAGRKANQVIGPGMKPIKEAMFQVAGKIGLNRSEAKQAVSKTVADNLRSEIAKMHGIADPNTIKLSEWALPESVFQRLGRAKDAFETPAIQRQLADMFDQITAVFKGFALAFPATKIRDIYSNAFLVWMEAGNPADVVHGIRAAKAVLAGNYDEAAPLLKELPGYKGNTNDIKQKMVEDVARTGVLQSMSTNDLITSNLTGELNQLIPGSTPMRRNDWIKELTPDGSRTATQMLQDQFQIRGVRLPGQKYKSPVTRNAMLNASEKASEYSDAVARLGGMFALMRQGVSADEAARRITDALVDYSSLTLFERGAMRRILPWYAYNSRSAKYIVSQLLSNPGGKYAQALRASRLAGESDEDTYVPEALRQQLAVRVPDELKPYLGIPEDSDTTTFFKDFDIPGVDTLNLLGRAPTLYGTLQSTASNLAQQTNPVLRSLYELGTGVDSFSRRPLDQAVTPLDRLYRRAFNTTTTMNPLVRMAINTVPGPHQRLISIGGGLADDRIPLQQRVAKQLFNSLAGIKIQDVDPEWQLQDARRQLENRLSGYMQDYTESYVPKDVLPNLPTNKLPDYMLFRTLGKQLRDQRKARRGQ